MNALNGGGSQEGSVACRKESILKKAIPAGRFHHRILAGFSFPELRQLFLYVGFSAAAPL